MSKKVIPLFMSIDMSDEPRDTVLVFMPNKFGYPETIGKEISKNGKNVLVYSDRPSDSTVCKSLIRLNPSAVHQLTSRYLKSIVKQNESSNVSIVLVIKGESFIGKDIQKLRASYPNARFVYYTWDSIANAKSSLPISSHFDQCFSFDRGDTINYPIFSFLPLFYNQNFMADFQKIPERNSFVYIGTAHPNKYAEVSNIVEQLSAHGFSGFVYHYLPSKALFYFYKATSSSFRHAKISDFHFVPLSQKEASKAISKSSIVIDSTPARQTGLPIRIIEAVGENKKILTTNFDIMNYDFYQCENIFVLNSKYIDFSSPFFATEYRKLDEKIYKKYSLSTWVNTLLGNN